MLQDVGGEAEIDGAVGERQQIAVGEHRALRGRAVRGQLRRIGLEEPAPGAAVAELRGEVAAAAADIGDHRAPQRHIPFDLVGGVPGEQPVAVSGVGPLPEKGPEQGG